MADSIEIDGLADAIANAMEEYRQETTDELKKEICKVAKETAREISDSAPRDTGEYAKSWKVKTVHESYDDIRVVICSPKRYRLTHLLENGYCRRDGTRVAAHPHIAPAEKRAAEKLGKKVKVIYSGRAKDAYPS